MIIYYRCTMGICNFCFLTPGVHHGKRARYPAELPLLDTISGNGSGKKDIARHYRWRVNAYCYLNWMFVIHSIHTAVEDDLLTTSSIQTE